MLLSTSPLAQTLMAIGSRLSLVSLSLFVGGIITLGANVAPLLFKTLARPDAGLAMTMIFRRFDAWMLAAVGLLILGEGLKLYGQGLPAELLSWIRLAVLVTFIGLILFSVLMLHPQLEAQQALQTVSPTMSPENLPGSEAFQAVHQQSEQLLRCAWVLALTLLIWR